MTSVLFVALFVTSFAAYQSGDAIPTQYQIKTTDVLYKWESLPYSARPKFGQESTFTLEQIGATFFYNDDFKIRFSFQNGRFVSPFIAIHSKGVAMATDAVITFGVSHANITSIALVPHLKDNTPMKSETFGYVSFTYRFKEKTHEYTEISKGVVTAISLLFTAVLAVLTYVRQSKK
ncbi:hypothetical protein EIN_425160 [Entamoeba invadens IP1]|uniref:Uncharacterized protein n=1 Tax=Entamoeba invadens IP1 TaxID=370355 RepID=A0A0A1UBW3_ENTIV|nr:hypothetical protein EIN_425160 [Entamoeba invadens IP1]ELP89794.1 hypothetical protein EIN_425160 [Entamoeba invadens IP1]|eukprot:XP_004256565.1 hypothetical protein EIN_425160 [Entamoeba invadens IP1]